MKNIATAAGVLIVIAIAILGLLLIFGIVSFDVASSNLFKVAAAIVLLAVCSALVALLARSGK